MQPNSFDDDIWDDLDDEDFEKCIIKEYEILSQNPSLLKKPLEYIKPETIYNDKDYSSNSKYASSFNSTSLQNIKKSCNVSENHKKSSLFKASPNSKPKKFYKPLDVGPSRNEPINEDQNSLQMKINVLLREKSKLEEDNFIKNGEIENLRCELKRQEVKHEAEYLDRCVALEEAEIRGKQKASKELSKTISKMTELEKEVDKLQGILKFKNLEIDELMDKYRRVNDQIGSSRNSYHKTHHNNNNSPSPKRRKTSLKYSPKNDLGFENSFDLNRCKISKNVSIQTDSVCHNSRRVCLNTSKHSEVLCSSLSMGLELASDVEIFTPQFSDNSNICEGSKDAFIKSIAEKLKDITEKANITSEQFRSNDKESLDLRRTKFYRSATPLIKALCRIDYLSCVQDLCQTVIKAVVHCLRVFIMLPCDLEGVKMCLHAGSHISRNCTDLDKELSTEICDCLRKITVISPMGTLEALLNTMTAFGHIENFRQSLCTNKPGDCLLARVSDLIGSNKCWSSGKRTSVNVFVASTLKQHFFASCCSSESSCNYKSSLLGNFVKNLYYQSQNISNDSDWHPIITGIRVIYLWMKKDEAFWDRVSHSSSYVALLSNVVAQFNYLKTNRIVDNFAWELLSELHIT